MRWYIPEPDPDVYDCLDFKSEYDSLQLYYFWGYENDYRPGFPESWTAIEVSMEIREKRADFLSLLGMIAFSQKSLSILEPLFGEETSFLEVTCKGTSFYVIKAEEVDCIDYTSSDVERYSSSNSVREIKSYAFKEDALVNKHIFRLPELKRITLVSDAFKETVIANDLKGLDFYDIKTVGSD